MTELKTAERRRPERQLSVILLCPSKKDTGGSVAIFIIAVVATTIMN